ncbi:DNA polymerase V, subunit C [Candidatus Terasakiella magnetica]|uniref:DNA-directed DNA polymerase n=1 Tax=Candidatus Terasakiella magnetica TaxID=1867952 RepID=A0A1C3RL75_9PROT|nr:Y-family DNA polymerase [Candidatus Terasakiella magnetica]SCA58034.1 DNA polymerase V, subunit C [Candidatus Terasakiella magnetica]
MSIVGLIDCNNFYASCERVFEPNLIGKPIVVLSNNDGCVIARSQEAKQMGIPMGEPFFKVKYLQREGLVVRSCNFPLYGDMSNRVMTCLSHFIPDVEIYSIDEAFLKLKGLEHLDLRAYSLNIRQTVLDWTGIPISIGIARTKTLCKIANKIAKNEPRRGGVEVLLSRGELHYGLATTPIGDVWGIGRRWAHKLKGDGIHYALDLANAPERWVRQKMGVVGLRTALELRGTACLAFEEETPDKKTICVSRSFGEMLESREDLEEAIKTFAMRAAEKLRRGKLVACQICVFIRTNAHRDELKQYRASQTLSLEYPNDDSRLIVQTMLKALRHIYRKGFQYKQAGVFLLELIPKSKATPSLLVPVDEKATPLMQALDHLNKRFGEGSVNVGQCKKTRHWYATRNFSSPRYTTCWQELPKVR